MSWELMLLVIIGSFLLLMIAGMPVAFCLILVDLVMMFVFWGGEAGLLQFIRSAFGAVTTFTIVPVILFMIMGEVMLHSGVGRLMTDSLDKFVGRVPGRLSLLAISGGTIFAMLSGTSMASVAMFGSLLVPDMEKRGYKKAMILGPIMATGSLAVMIPPSGLAVLVGAIGEISIGNILIAIIVPGLILAAFYVAYIVIRAHLQPQLAPAYTVALPPVSERLVAAVRYILPLASIIFLAVGLIFLGIATPGEASAAGAIGCFVLTAAYGKLNWDVTKKTFIAALHISGMVLMIMVGATAFSQVMAFSGATSGLAELVTSLNVPSVIIIISMLFVVLIMGCFMDAFAIMMICLPIFVPAVAAMGYDLVWFAVLFLLVDEVATITPPFGLVIFVMKSVAPPNITISDIYKSTMPFIGIHVILMVLLLAFPILTLWLPSLMR